jgi:hypothetical protein
MSASNPVMSSINLLCGRQLVWVGTKAEIRDQHGRVEHSGTYRQMDKLAKAKGLYMSQAPHRN